MPKNLESYITQLKFFVSLLRKTKHDCFSNAYLKDASEKKTFWKTKFQLHHFSNKETN